VLRRKQKKNQGGEKEKKNRGKEEEKPGEKRERGEKGAGQETKGVEKKSLRSDAKEKTQKGGKEN